MITHQYKHNYLEISKAGICRDAKSAAYPDLSLAALPPTRHLEMTALSFFGIIATGAVRFTVLPSLITRSNKQMKNYPHLAEMGVVNPQQIDNYSVNSIGYTDVLRILYERPKGSLLPASKTFKFPRVQQTVKGQAEVTMNSAPAFRAAVAELQDILEVKGQDQDVAAAIAEELRLLEEDIALRSQCIKRLLDNI